MKGLLPALDRRAAGEPHIVDGRNFIIDAQGPKSYWGNLILSNDQLPPEERLGVQSFRLGENSYDTVLLTSKAIYKYDVNSDSLYPIFVFSSSPESVGRWSMAFVGGEYFFAKLGYDLHKYNPVFDTWEVITLNVPSGLVACCESDGRLILLGANEVRRSAIDNGIDLADNPSTGVGARALTLVGGDPIFVARTFEGHLVWTTEGIIRAEAINEQVPFRYTGIANKEFAPVSAWAIAEVERNRYVWLSQTGMYQTNGQATEPYQPLLSEYLVTKILKDFDLTVPNILLLHYSKEQRILFVSIAESQRSFNYTKAFTLYVPRDEWGSFDKLHYGWVELGLTEGVNIGFNFGFVCGGGYIHKLILHPYQEVPAADNSQVGDYEYIPGEIQTPTYKLGTSYIVSSDLVLSSVNPGTFTETGYWKEGTGEEFISQEPASDGYIIDAFTGKDYLAGPTPDQTRDYLLGDSSVDYMVGYLINEPATEVIFLASAANTSIEQMPTEYDSIDSSITIGPYRVSDGQQITQLWLMDRLSVGMLPAPEADIIIDYLTVGNNEDIFTDYMASVEDVFIDYGGDLISSVNYAITTYSTADGFNVFENNTETPFEYATELTPDQYTRHFTSEVLGIWSYVQIDALAQSQNFHLKLLEVEGTVKGRLE